MRLRIPNKDEYHEKINFSAAQIGERVKALGAQISEDYPNGLTLLCNQKSALVFVADLIRSIDVNVRLEVLEFGSLQHDEEAAPILFLRQADELIIDGQDCLICTDVVRTGFTMHFLLDQLYAKTPKTLQICTLLSNPEQLLLPLPLRYTGFETDYDSLCGYGIPFKGEGRQFPDIVQLVPDK